MKMEKINIAVLLKECPKGMELESPMYDNLVFCEIDSEAYDYPIITQLPHGVQKRFTSDGRYELNPNAKCVIFPKGKTTWEGFVPPCKFKVGDKVVFRDAKDKPLTIRKIWWDNEILCSFNEDDIDVPIEDLDRYVTPKFDINTLKPFDKVLVRGDVGQRWIIDFFGFMDNKKGYPFVCVGHYVIQCVPYEGNEHLLDTTDDCDDFYKTWK